MNKALRKTVIAGNWKMNRLASEIPSFADELLTRAGKACGAEVVLCVPFPLISAAVSALDGIHVGAQDVSAHDHGAYTGEVSAAMLKDIDADYCIVGHSERRAYHAESNELVNRKVLALLAQNIAPILCVGESLNQREAGETLAFISGQIREGLRGVTAEQAAGVVIAYEPIWAIGTGRTATAEQAEEVCAHIRMVLAGLYGEPAAARMSILYGGSMNAGNAVELLAQPDIDGGLIGGASLKPAEFAEIIRLGSENE